MTLSIDQIMAQTGNRPAGATTVSVEHVRHLYQKAGAPNLLVLDDVSFQLHEGEIVALLGRSGSGKSTLLRIIAGLLQPTGGSVAIDGRPVNGPAESVSMVFQSFALFPWLTVLENVELGLEAQGVPRAERRKQALWAIDLIGLDGFESAYPRELSGGMRQRVGLARALVTRPGILLMDEPFSALDVLTAETIRTDLLDLWSEGRMPIRSMLMVTHNIEEAVLMCDRILVFSSNPGRIVAEIAVDLPRPRDRQDPAFRALVDSIYARMTGSAETGRTGQSDGAVHGTGTAMMLSRVSTNTLAGLMETIAGPPFGGKADLPLLGERTHLEAHDLIKAVETLQLLHFAEVAEGDVTLTPDGLSFAELGVDERKALFARNLLLHLPLVARIRKVLDERPNHRAPRLRFQDELEDHMSEEAAIETLNTVTNWARYAEVFAYDEASGLLSLDNPG
jgi:NitT/TauT family transport system ATP-binding protein